MLYLGGIEMISTNIKKYRKLKGLTQKELAEKCNCATGTIQQYELNKRQPRLEQLNSIANALDISIIDLLGDNFEIKQGSGHIYDAKTQSYKPYTGNYIDLTDRAKLLDAYDNLNELGKKEALKRVEELTEINKYIEE